MSEAVLSASIELPAGSLNRKGLGWWGLLCAIASEGALFAYLLFAYYYDRVEIGREFVPGPLPELKLALPNTIILLVSSATCWLSEQAIKRNKRAHTTLWLLVSFVLGVVFVAIQLLEWKSKPYSISSHAYGSLYFTTTGFHMAHVAAGLVGLALAVIWCVRGYFDSHRHVPLIIVSAYWHFVDAVWLTVFFTYYVTPRLWS